MKKPSLIFLCILGVSSILRAQYSDYFNFGLKAGANYSQIKNVPEMLVSNQFSPLVKLKTQAEFGGMFGGFLSLRFDRSSLAIQPELLFSMEHSRSEYYENNALRYSLDFKYNYFQINTLVKFYPISGLNVGIGPQFGFNLSPDDLVFEDKLYPERNLQIQQEMRNASTGRGNFQLLFNLGYEFKNGISLESRYALGLSDVIRTDTNALNWKENNNTTSNFQFSIGYAFGLSNL